MDTAAAPNRDGRGAHRGRRIARAIVIGLFVTTSTLSLGTLLVLARTSARESDRAWLASRALATLYRLNAIESSAEALDHVAPDEFATVARQLVSEVEDAAAHLDVTERIELNLDATSYVDAVTQTIELHRDLRDGDHTGPEAAAIAGQADVFDLTTTGPIYEHVAPRHLSRVSDDAHDRSVDASASSRNGIVLMLATSIGSFVVFGWWLARSNRQAAARKVERSANARFRSLVESLTDQVYLIGDGGSITYLSPGAERIWDGKPPVNVSQLLDAIEEPARSVLASAASEGGMPTEAVAARVRWPDGTLHDLEITIRDQRDDPNLRGLVVTGRDVTAEAELQERLRQQAQEDDLTGLSNRRSVNASLVSALARARRRQRHVALVLVDLDGFKGVNDTLGHPVGDELLRQVAKRMRPPIARTGEIVARLGGDEFAVVFEDVGDEREATVGAHRFLDALRDPYEVHDKLLSINASLGLALGDHDLDVDGLMRHADIALYDAKQAGRNRLVAFHPEMEQLALAAARLQRELSTALERDELSLVYQPLCSVATGEPLELEALMRWSSPALGEVSPLTFIPVAERSGLIVELGRWALLTACRQLAAWQAELPGQPLGMSVNVSVLQLAEATFVDDVRSVLAATGVAPHDLQLEVTESALANDLDRMSAQLSEVRALGVRVALDDFGTGYSSMGQLQQLPVDCIKIDRSFVAALRTGGDRARSVIDALIDLGSALGLSIVAEGIEDEEQLLAFRRDDCDLAQGYLLARPMRADAAFEFVRSHSKVSRPS